MNPVSLSSSNYISISAAAELLQLSSRQVRNMCIDRVFKTATKPGVGAYAHWRIQKNEVLARMFDRHIPEL